MGYNCGQSWVVFILHPTLDFQDMIFGDSEGCDWRNPKRSQRERSLASALTNIIWRAGDGNTGEGKPTSCTTYQPKTSDHIETTGNPARSISQKKPKSAERGATCDNINPFNSPRFSGLWT